MLTDELTCVTGYWAVKNKHGDSFPNWFPNTLNVDHPYVVFCDEARAQLEIPRQPFPTAFARLPLAQCYLYDKQDRVWTHEYHCPSTELNVIWNEKVFLIERALNINPYGSEWFVWLDAGICVWRERANQRPLRLNRDALRKLPKDKLVFSSSIAEFVPEYVASNMYYHHVAGTAFLLHRNIVATFCAAYRACLDRLLNQRAAFIDQGVFTHLYAEQPDLFFKLTHGYGAVANYLFS